MRFPGSGLVPTEVVFSGGTPFVPVLAQPRLGPRPQGGGLDRRRVVRGCLCSALVAIVLVDGPSWRFAGVFEVLRVALALVLPVPKFRNPLMLLLVRLKEEAAC